MAKRFNRAGPLAAALAVFFWATACMAGSFSIVRDEGRWFSAQDVEALRGEAGSWPIDVRVLVEEAASRDQLEDDAHKALDGKHSVVVAIDHVHRRVAARYGVASGVKTADYDVVAKAGNAHFRAGEARQGVEAIVARARASAEASAPITEATAPPVVVEHGMTAGATVWLLLLGGLGAGLCLWLYFRSKRNTKAFREALDENRVEMSELRSRNIEEAKWSEGVRAERAAKKGPVFPPPAPTVVNNVVQGGGGGDFATGLLVGEVLSRPREVVVFDQPSPLSSDDSGGSSSSYSGGKSPSYDSGGSSSSYDSGGSSYDSGGFDSGGGGGDFGGGGGDF